MDLNLKNPLVFFDLETTGINITRDRIVEISLLKVHPNGKEESKTRRINPEMPIPPESTAIHGITDEDVKDCPTFKQVAKSLAEMLEDIRKQLNFTTLRYHRLDDMIEAIGLPKCKLCTYCFDGKE